MKKLIYICLLGLLCSCSKDSDSISVADKKGNITFLSSIESRGTTRAGIGEKDSDGKYPILWSTGDSISVVGVKASPWNEKFLLANGAGTTEASFSGECSLSSDGYYVVYPYCSSTKPDHSDTYDPYMPDIAWNGSQQIAHPGSFDPTKGIMVAYSEDTESPVSIDFKHVCSYIKFTTNYKCKSVTFEALDSTKIACKDFTVKMSADNTPNIVWANSQTAKITLKAGESGVIPAGTYYIATLPAELSEGFRITFNSATLSIKSYPEASTKTVNLVRGHILNLGEFDLASYLPEFAGSGTEDDPYVVSDFQELDLISHRCETEPDKYSSAYYRQTNDIDANGRKLYPIGTAGQMFEGHYDGGGFTISNPVYSYIENYFGPLETYKCFGLFGDIRNAYIENVIVENPTIDSTDNGIEVSHWMMETGGIVGHAYSDVDYNGGCYIYNCKTFGDLTYVKSLYNNVLVGGILGACNAHIRVFNCVNNMSFPNVLSEGAGGSTNIKCSGMGGIIGYAGPVQTTSGGTYIANTNVLISRCRNNGNIGFNMDGFEDFELTGIAGIIGITMDSIANDVLLKVGNCVNTGKIYSRGSRKTGICLGGIVGHNDSDAYGDKRPLIFNCLNTGTIMTAGLTSEYSVEDYAGGIVGYNYSDATDVVLCVSTGDLFLENVATLNSGDITGKNGTLTNCFNKDTYLSIENLNNLLEAETSYFYPFGQKIEWTTVDNQLDLKFL